MYNAGNILYFTPFYFKNGSTAKPKYFVILEMKDELFSQLIDCLKDSKAVKKKYIRLLNE